MLEQKIQRQSSNNLKVAKDQISIQQLRCLATIGVTDAERQQQQALVFDVRFEVNAQQLAQHDAIHLTVNYAEMCQVIDAYCQQHSFKLIETMAEKLSQYLLDRFRLSQIALTIHKKPFDLPQLNAVSIHVERSR